MQTRAPRGLEPRELVTADDSYEFSTRQLLDADATERSGLVGGYLIPPELKELSPCSRCEQPTPIYALVRDRDGLCPRCVDDQAKRDEQLEMRFALRRGF
jgi:hypothetical protein